MRGSFDPGAACLDFAYTGAMPGWPGQELLRDPGALGEWLASRFERIDAASVGQRELVDALQLRAAIARLALALSSGAAPDDDDVDTVNLFAATPDIPPSLDGGRRRAGATRLRAAQALATLARDAVDVLGRAKTAGAEADRSGPGGSASGGSGPGELRLRRCAADDCELVFQDESRTNSRRWCSMDRCGNRAKVRAHRERAASSRAAALLDYQVSGLS